MLRDCPSILLIDLERSDLHIDEGGLDICMTHQLHEGRQANAGAHHIRREGMPQGLLILLMICTQQRFAIGVIRSMA